MNLTDIERRWLPWFGSTGKIAMRKSCLLNNNRIKELEISFENIAQTRVDLLKAWTNNQWAFLENAALYLSSKEPQERGLTLRELLARGKDFSELFIVANDGKPLYSSYSNLGTANSVGGKALEAGLEKPFLHGPYKDPRTLEVGPSSSKFHDEVTLMFYQPLDLDGERACLCGRVPNDVIGDIIQREAGHIYSESGDNYIFMVNANFDSSIAPGTALSRSRFEDNTFSHGENLKQGVTTDWGMVKVERHTEFEIVFTDPATKQLHPGVRETIKNGNNLYVEYPGYSDYRHIPVIGKGVTFSLPGSPDLWGMMCESDLEEVYRHRSLSYTLTKKFTLGMLTAGFITFGLFSLANFATWLQVLLSLLVVSLSISGFYIFVAKPLAMRSQQMAQVMQTLAEGDGNLTQRLDFNLLKADEIGGLGRWTNSFIDNLEGVMSELIFASSEVSQVTESMLRRTQKMSEASIATSSSIENMLLLARTQQQEIENANQSARKVEQVMESSMQSAALEFEQATDSANQIKSIVESSADSVNEVNAEMQKITGIVKIITEITEQTNLLALNAAIEAARAGEHGRGFSVVADEVRSLANRTSESANSIDEMMKQLHAQTQTAVKYMEQGIESVENNAVMVNSSQRSDQMHSSVAELFSIINDISGNSAQHSKTVDIAQESSEQLVLSSQQMGRRTTLMKNALARLDELISRFEVRQA